MAKIGTFKKAKGEYRGAIACLALSVDAVRIVPEDNPKSSAPTHRIYVGDVEVGAAWEKTSQDDRTYLSTKFDDPSFTAPFFAQLRWLRLAHEQWCMGNACTIACLVPARTDSVWFHETFRADADVYFLQGRVRFIDLRGGSQVTPFSLMLVVFGAAAEQNVAYAEAVAGIWMARK
jgi:uncharacterized protein (DUF736 family)